MVNNVELVVQFKRSQNKVPTQNKFRRIQFRLNDVVQHIFRSLLLLLLWIYHCIKSINKAGSRYKNMVVHLDEKHAFFYVEFYQHSLPVAVTIRN